MNVLIVCTGNICRSPMAEQLLTARLGGDDVRFSSAGTGALVGEPMTREAAGLSARYGGDPAKHAARQLTERVVLDADLVLTATRAHRAQVAELVPRAARRAFTLREFARVVDHLAAAGELGAAPVGPPGPHAIDGIAGRLRRAADAAARFRGLAPPLSDPTDDDIPDPYRGSAARYDEAGRLIDAAVGSIVAALATAVSGGHRGP